jgi:hypothetical protein
MLCNPGQKARSFSGDRRPGGLTIRLKRARVKLYGLVVADKSGDARLKSGICLSW